MVFIVSADERTVSPQQVGAVQKIGTAIRIKPQGRTPEKNRRLGPFRPCDQLHLILLFTLQDERCRGFRPHDQVSSGSQFGSQPIEALHCFITEGPVPLYGLIDVRLDDSNRNGGVRISCVAIAQDRRAVDPREYHAGGRSREELPGKLDRVKPTEEGHDPQDQFCQRKIHQDNEERNAVHACMVCDLNQFQFAVLRIPQKAPGKA